MAITALPMAITALRKSVFCFARRHIFRTVWKIPMVKYYVALRSLHHITEGQIDSSTDGKVITGFETILEPNYAFADHFGWGIWVKNHLKVTGIQPIQVEWTKWRLHVIKESLLHTIPCGKNFPFTIAYPSRHFNASLPEYKLWSP